jgi:hypothetical protein
MQNDSNLPTKPIVESSKYRVAAVAFAFIVALAASYVAICTWVVANLDAAIALNEKQTNQSGAGEVVYQGIAFSNIYEAREAVEQDNVASCFSWAYKLPASLPLILAALSFGILGGVGNVMYKAIGSRKQSDVAIALTPLFGAILGLMVFGVTYLLPAVLTVDNNMTTRPISVVFLALYAGVFSNHVYNWIEEQAVKKFFADPKMK